MGGVRARLRAQHREVEAERVGVGELEGGRRVDEEQAVAATGVDITEAVAVDLVRGDGGGERDAGVLAAGDEALHEAQPALLGDGAGEARGERDLAGLLRDAARAREQGAAVGELALGVAEEQVQRERAAEGVAGRLGVQQAGDALGGEAVELWRVRGLERGEAAELGHGAVAEAVEEDREQAERHGRARAQSRRSAATTRATAGGTSAAQSSPAAMRRRTSVAATALGASGVRISTA